MINLVLGLGREKHEKATTFHVSMPWETDEKETRPSATAGELEAARAALNQASVFN